MLGTLLLGALLLIDAPDAPDVPEPGSREAIAKATTDPRFLSPWVADVPASATVPSPTGWLGHIVGAPGELTRTERIYGYYRALAAATPRVKVETIGTSEEGREILLVIVGDERNLARLPDLRADAAALADPRRTDEAALERIVASTAPFYMLHGGLHSQETGSPEMLMELAYRLAVSNASPVKDIREKLVVLINPCAEPDGRDRQVDWFYRHLKGKTDFDNLPPRTPPFWGRYAFHDNNRDGIQRKLALTRATQDAFLAWHPIVVHDLHESIPLLTIWTGTGPYNANVDPITAVEIQAFAFHEVTALTSFGMPGVWSWGFTEGWSQFYADSVAANHNAIGRGYETFGNATAETVERWIDAGRYLIAEKPVTEKDWYRPVPPSKKPFLWSLRDNTNYMQTGVLSALDYAARHRADMLRNFWRRGRNAIEKGRKEKPHAIALPEAQRDRAALALLVDLLHSHGIEVGRTTAPFKAKERSLPAGTYLVRLDQPYGGYARDLLLPQEFPIEDATFEPYDDVSWSLPPSLGVEAVPIEDEAILQAPAGTVASGVRVAGRVAPGGPVFLLKDTGQESLLLARVKLSRFTVEVSEAPFKVGAETYPAGSWVLPAQEGLRAELEALAREVPLDFTTARALPEVARHALELPRIGLLSPWSDTQAAGWLRLIFDEEKVPFTLLTDDDVKAGGLLSRVDVILFPHTGDELDEIVNGFDPSHAPLAYTRTPEFPTHGTPASSPDITGGLSWKGVGNLEEFVRGGGLLVTLGGASTLPLDGGLARDVRRAKTEDLNAPGSHLRARFTRPSHPLAYGYEEKLTVLRQKLPVYEARRSDRGRMVLHYGAAEARDPAEDEKEWKEREKREKAARKDAGKAGKEEGEGEGEDDDEKLVVSGGIKGEKELVGKPAILDIPTGKGRIVAFDFDPIHRCQSRATFRLVWNALLNWNDLPPVPKMARVPPMEGGPRLPE